MLFRAGCISNVGGRNEVRVALADRSTDPGPDRAVFAVSLSKSDQAMEWLAHSDVTKGAYDDMAV
jgi:hypothetical protein